MEVVLSYRDRECKKDDNYHLNALTHGLLKSDSFWKPVRLIVLDQIKEFCSDFQVFSLGFQQHFKTTS